MQELTLDLLIASLMPIKDFLVINGYISPLCACEFNVMCGVMVCSWDEWVPESRVLKLTDASRQKQKELQNAHMYVDVLIITCCYL